MKFIKLTNDKGVFRIQVSNIVLYRKADSETHKSVIQYSGGFIHAHESPEEIHKLISEAK